MAISRFLLPSLAAIAFACTALVADAQTGPTGSPNKTGAQAGQAKRLTPERVAALLNSKVQTEQDGSKTIIAKVSKDGWQFEVIVSFLPDGKVFDIISPLTGANPNLTQAQIQGLEQKNKEMQAAQKAFILNKQDGRLYFANINFRVDISEQAFAQELNAHCQVIRDSYDLWRQ